MNRNHALALVVSLAAMGTASADDITIDPHPFVSTATRAQVLDELRQYRQAGINPWAEDYNPIAHHRSGMSRAEATAGFLASREAVARMSAEDSGSSYLAQQTATEGGAIVVARAQ